MISKTLWVLYVTVCSVRCGSFMLLFVLYILTSKVLWIPQHLLCFVNTPFNNLSFFYVPRRTVVEPLQPISTTDFGTVVYSNRNFTCFFFQPPGSCFRILFKLPHELSFPYSYLLSHLCDPSSPLYFFPSRSLSLSSTQRNIETGH